MLEALIFEALFEDCSDFDATALSLENEVALGIRLSHDLGLEQFLLEFIELRLEVFRPRDFVGPRHFVEGVTDMREG